MPIRLLTRGDDLGSFDAATGAILDAYKNGILKNTSIMAPTPHFESAAARVRNERGLCIGLHLTFTAEWASPKWGPVLPREKVPSLLAEDGNFPADIMPVFRRGIRLDEMMAEAQAQLAMARAAGLNIEYIDEHMGIGWVHEPGDQKFRFADRVREWSRKEGLIYDADHHTKWPPVDPSVPKPDELGGGLREHYMRRIEAAPDGVYFMVTHPAFDTPEMQALSFHVISPPAKGIHGVRRGADHKLLCDPEFIAFLKRKNVELIRYTDFK